MTGEEELDAAKIATKAAELVGGDRQKTHGSKFENFSKIAELWNAWMRIRRDPSLPLNTHDVGIMMSLLKSARTQLGDYNPDDGIDHVGYAACAAEVEPLCGSQAIKN